MKSSFVDEYVKDDIITKAKNLFKKDTKLVFPLTEFTTHIV